MAKAGLIFFFNHGAEAPCKTQWRDILLRLLSFSGSRIQEQKDFYQ